MYAAVVSSFENPPCYQEFPDPEPANDQQAVVRVLAAGLHPRVRSQADGSHYTSTDELPLIPGIDGVGRLMDGSTVYFVLPDTARGSMAERVAIDLRRSVPLADGIDPVAVAAGMNPAMSSWVALRRRIEFEPGQRVLVLGATGNAGRLAVQIAKYLGAAEVIGAGRNATRLDALKALGADAIVSLDGDDRIVAEMLAETAAEVDVVIDYLWARPAERAMTALLRARTDRARLLSWVQIGSMAGPDLALASAILRAANLRVLGSGQGSASTSAILEELPALARLISDGTFVLDARTVPLSEVAQAWSATANGTERIVIRP